MLHVAEDAPVRGYLEEGSTSAGSSDRAVGPHSPVRGGILLGLQEDLAREGRLRQKKGPVLRPVGRRVSFHGLLHLGQGGSQGEGGLNPGSPGDVG